MGHGEAALVFVNNRDIPVDLKCDLECQGTVLVHGSAALCTTDLWSKATEKVHGSIVARAVPGGGGSRIFRVAACK